jgi:serine/threonine protein kinase
VVFKIADFGIGALATSQLVTVTTHQPLTGVKGAFTPLYASPQQIRGEQPDPRDDVHALGVIWYQLLTADLTAGAPAGTRWLKRLAQAGMTQPLLDLLASCIEADPNDRPADAAVLAAEPRRLPASSPVIPGRVRTRGQIDTSVSAARPGPVETPPSRRRPW